MSVSKFFILVLFDVLSVFKLEISFLFVLLSDCKFVIFVFIVVKALVNPFTEDWETEPEGNDTDPEQFNETASILLELIVVLNSLYKAFKVNDGRLTQELIYICWFDKLLKFNVEPEKSQK